MGSTRTLYVILALPTQNVAQQLASFGFSDYCVDAERFRVATGNPQFALDEAGDLSIIDSPSGAKRARQMFELALNRRLEAGDPTIVLGGAGKSGLRFIRQIDPAFGYTIRLVDFIAPLIKDFRDQKQWQAFKDAADALDDTESAPLCDWISDLDREDWHAAPAKLQKAQIAELVRSLYESHTYSKPDNASDIQRARRLLSKYERYPWADLGEMMSPEEFKAEIQAPLRFPSLSLPSPFSPATRPLLIIGDVHGDADDLAAILAKWPSADITMLGDYFDRGPQNAEVFKLLMDQRHRIHLLCGNHELALRKALIEARGIGGGLAQETLTQLADAGISVEDVRLFLSELETYRAFRYRTFNFFMCHAGIEPELLEQWQSIAFGRLRVAFASTEAFVYGVKQVGGSAYERDIDQLWVNEANAEYATANTFLVHGHRNRFDHAVLTSENSANISFNLADGDTTTIRYLEIDGTHYAMHVRQRFTDEETVIEGNLR